MERGASLVAQTVKNLPEMRETWVHSLGRKDPLEMGMATHSSILAWRMPWAEEPGWATVHEVTKESNMVEQLSMHAHTMERELKLRDKGQMTDG